MFDAINAAEFAGTGHSNKCLCLADINPCVVFGGPELCHNHGVCRTSHYRYYCVCEALWYGSTCGKSLTVATSGTSGK